MYVFIYLVKPASLSVHLLGNSCSHGLRFSLCKYLTVNLVFPTFVFGVDISFLMRHFLIIAYFFLFKLRVICMTDRFIEVQFDSCIYVDLLCSLCISFV